MLLFVLLFIQVFLSISPNDFFHLCLEIDWRFFRTLIGISIHARRSFLSFRNPKFPLEKGWCAMSTNDYQKAAAVLVSDTEA